MIQHRLHRLHAASWDASKLTLANCHAVPYPGFPWAVNAGMVADRLMGVSADWRHLCRLFANHVHDKFHKKIMLCFTRTSTVVLLTDMIVAQRALPQSVTGVDGTMTDMSSSTQNNKRAEQMASFQFAIAIAKHVPMAQVSAVHVMLAATHLRAFKDMHGLPPYSPRARLVLIMFCNVIHVYAALAVGYTKPKSSVSLVSQYPLSLQVNGYSSQTRTSMFLSLYSIVSMLAGQADSHARAPSSVHPLVMQQAGSQHCENSFSLARCPSQQNTGSLSCVDLLKSMSTYMSVMQSVSSGDLIMPASRKSADKHSRHQANHSAYHTIVSPECMQGALHVGFVWALDFLQSLGYKAVIKTFPTFGSAMRGFLKVWCVWYFIYH